jgi:hypothetical protein
LDSKNQVVAETKTTATHLDPHGDASIPASLAVSNPKLRLTRLAEHSQRFVKTTAYKNGSPVDQVSTRIGIRTIRITKENGIEINGEPLAYLSAARTATRNMPTSAPRSPIRSTARDAIKFKKAGIQCACEPDITRTTSRLYRSM